MSVAAKCPGSKQNNISTCAHVVVLRLVCPNNLPLTDVVSCLCLVRCHFPSSIFSFPVPRPPCYTAVPPTISPALMTDAYVSATGQYMHHSSKTALNRSPLSNRGTRISAVNAPKATSRSSTIHTRVALSKEGCDFSLNVRR